MPWLHWFTAAKPIDEPLMLDDTVGALTRSVYDSSANTDIAFTKLLPTLKSIQSKAIEFTSQTTDGSTRLGNALKLSTYSTQRSLSESEQITNGISGQASAAILTKLIKSMHRSNQHIVNAIKHKNILKETIDYKNKSLATLGRDVSGKTVKSFSLMSVADKICQGAHTLQSLSKNVIDRAERHHLALASPSFKLGVANVSKILAIEKKILPIQTVPPKDIVPQVMDSELESAYQHNNRAIDYAEKALTLNGSARAREVVDVRDQLRTVLDKEQDVIDLKRMFTDKKLVTEIAPRNLRLNKIINEELVPEILKFKEINDKILKTVDANHSIQIDTGISRKVMKQSGFGNECLVGTQTFFVKPLNFYDFL